MKKTKKLSVPEEMKPDLIRLYLDRIQKRELENEEDKKLLRVLGYKPDIELTQSSVILHKEPVLQWRYEANEAIKKTVNTLISVSQIVSQLESKHGKFATEYRNAVSNKISAACSQLFINKKVGRIKIEGIKENFYGKLDLFETDRVTLKPEFKHLKEEAA